MHAIMKYLFDRNAVEAFPQACADMQATHQREVGRLVMRERSSIRARVAQLDKHIAITSASLAELKGERDQLEAQYVALALDLSRHGVSGLEMTIPAAGQASEVA